MDLARPGLAFGISGERLSDLGDHLEAFTAAVDSEVLCPKLDAALAYSGKAKNAHIGIDRRLGVVRTWLATGATAHERSSRLREGLLDKTNTAASV